MITTDHSHLQCALAPGVSSSTRHHGPPGHQCIAEWAPAPCYEPRCFGSAVNRQRLVMSEEKGVWCWRFRPISAASCNLWKRSLSQQISILLWKENCQFHSQMNTRIERMSVCMSTWQTVQTRYEPSVAIINYAQWSLLISHYHPSLKVRTPMHVH